MPTDSTWLTLLLGPAGLTVGLLFALYKFQRGDWVARERLDELRAQRDKAVQLAETSAGGSEAMATAIAALKEAIRDSSHKSPGLSAEIRDAEERITRPRTSRRGDD